FFFLFSLASFSLCFHFFFFCVSLHHVQRIFLHDMKCDSFHAMERKFLRNLERVSLRGIMRSSIDSALGTSAELKRLVYYQHKVWKVRRRWRRLNHRRRHLLQRLARQFFDKSKAKLKPPLERAPDVPVVLEKESLSMKIDDMNEEDAFTKRLREIVDGPAPQKEKGVAHAFRSLYKVIQDGQNMDDADDDDDADVFALLEREKRLFAERGEQAPVIKRDQQRVMIGKKRPRAHSHSKVRRLRRKYVAVFKVNHHKKNHHHKKSNHHHKKRHHHKKTHLQLVAPASPNMNILPGLSSLLNVNNSIELAAAAASPNMNTPHSGLSKFIDLITRKCVPPKKN
ncbi:hypothetical protein BC940DRAFT_353184, partial [Gongronella butleri]